MLRDQVFGPVFGKLLEWVVIWDSWDPELAFPGGSASLVLAVSPFLKLCLVAPDIAESGSDQGEKSQNLKVCLEGGGSFSVTRCLVSSAVFLNPGCPDGPWEGFRLPMPGPPSGS